MAKKEECRIKPWCELSACPYPYAVQCKHCKHYTETIGKSEKEEPAKKPIKTLLYCAKAKPFLYENYLSGKGEFVLAAKRNVLPRARVLNGTVCFECEINKVEKIRHAYSPLGDDLFFTKSVSIPVDFEKRTCLNTEQLNSYLPYYALYLTNVKAIKPFPITGMARRDPTGLNIAQGLASGMLRAPQNMCWEWKWDDKNRKWERVLVLSLRPKNLCNIANGLKDIETRRQVVNEIKEMEK